MSNKRCKKTILLCVAMLIMSIMFTACGGKEKYEEKSVTQVEDASPADDASASGDNAELKEFLKEYEEWVDDYILLLEKYKDNPADTAIIAEYTESLKKLAEWNSKSETMKVLLEKDPDALTEYMEAITKIIQKLSAITE